MQSPYVLSSPPVEIHWAGFRATTVELQSTGWELSYERDSRTLGVRIAMRHREAAMHGMTAPIDDMPRALGPDFCGNRGDGGDRIIASVPANMIARDIKIITELKDPFANFHAFDAVPAVITMDEWFISGADIFRKIQDLPEAKKVFLADAGEHDLLREIIERQQPKQDEIRERLRLARLRGECHVPAQNVEAQIIRLSDYGR